MVRPKAQVPSHLPDSTNGQADDFGNVVGGREGGAEGKKDDVSGRGAPIIWNAVLGTSC